MTGDVEAAGIAPASQIPQIVSQHSTWLEQGYQSLHDVCTDAVLRELVANWHRLVPSVRAAILDLARRR